MRAAEVKKQIISIIIKRELNSKSKEQDDEIQSEFNEVMKFELSKPENKEFLITLSIADVIAMLPTDKEAANYANGYFGFPEDYIESRIISASENAFVSGCDWMLNEIKKKLKGNS